MKLYSLQMSEENAPPDDVERTVAYLPAEEGRVTYSMSQKYPGGLYMVFVADEPIQPFIHKHGDVDFLIVMTSTHIDISCEEYDFSWCGILEAQVADDTVFYKNKDGSISFIVHMNVKGQSFAIEENGILDPDTLSNDMFTTLILFLIKHSDKE